MARERARPSWPADRHATLLRRAAQEDKEFDFDGQGSSDPVGAGWGMDDLDSMLLKGMQKKRQQYASPLPREQQPLRLRALLRGPTAAPRL